tara:strand:- start:1667 stop:1864 length:198 start_codon:yes stop_codon:yes gene_type:complete
MSQKRKYLFNSSKKEAEKVFLVYYYDGETTFLRSSGHYFDETMAVETMKGHLANGNCSWVVTYNE